MSVVIKRKGVKFVATLPEGHDWSIRVFNGRLVAACSDHPPIILGMNPEPEWIPINFVPTGDPRFFG